MKSLKSRVHNLEKQSSPKKLTLLEMMDIASGKTPRDPTYVEPKPQTREELEAQVNEPGLVGEMAQAGLRVMKYCEEEKGN